MANIQSADRQVYSVMRRSALQLLLSYFVTFVVIVLFHTRVEEVIFACSLGFTLTLIIPYNLYLLEIALNRLSRGLAVDLTPSPLHWPLKQLFVLVNNLSSQTGRQVQIEQRNVAYRDQLIQQVGKTAAQEERNRLARDLHDSIKQQIFSIVVSAAAVKARWERNAASALKVVEDIERTAQEAQIEMQALLQQLRPTALENVGLVESLRMQCQALGYRTGADVSAELEALPADDLLPLGTQEMIFRIVQEGFANIARHARAAHVWLSLQRQDNFMLVEIGDDGQGFDLAQMNEMPKSYGGMGLCNVRERISSLGGVVNIWSVPAKGTTLHLCIPLVKAQSHEHEHEEHQQLLAEVARKTRRMLTIGTRVVELAAASMVLYLPTMVGTIFIFLSLLVAAVFWLWAQQYRLQFVLDFGREHAQNFLLQARSYALLTGVLILCLLYPYYFPDLHLFEYSSFEIKSGFTILVFSGVLLLAITTSCFFALRNFYRYDKTLSLKALQEQIQQLVQQIVVDGIVWAVVFGLTFSLWTLFSAKMAYIIADTTSQAIGFVTLAFWLLSITLKVARTIRCNSLLRQLEEHPAIERNKVNI